MCALWHTTLWTAAICKLAKPYLFKKIGHYYPVIINVSLLSHFWLPLLWLWNNQHHNYFYDTQVIELSLTWHHPFGFDLISLLSWLCIRVLVFSYRLFPVYGPFHTSQQCVSSCFQERRRTCSLEKSCPNLLLHTKRKLIGLTFGASPHSLSLLLLSSTFGPYSCLLRKPLGESEELHPHAFSCKERNRLTPVSAMARWKIMGTGLWTKGRSWVFSKARVFTNEKHSRSSNNKTKKACRLSRSKLVHRAQASSSFLFFLTTLWRIPVVPSS